MPAPLKIAGAALVLASCAARPDAPTDVFVDPEKRCAGGDRAACLEAGKELTRSNDPAWQGRGFPLLERACALGDAWACSWVAQGYDTGFLGAPGKDPARALPIKERACELGMVADCVELFIRYRHGKSEVRDEVKALAIEEHGLFFVWPLEGLAKLLDPHR